MTTLGGLLDVCREVTGGDAEWVPVPEEELLAAGVEPWVHLPLWLPADDRAAPPGTSTRPARASSGLPSRPLRESVADTWAWQQTDRAAAARRRTAPSPACRPTWRRSCSPRR